jgi:hypothetical protein
MATHDDVAEFLRRVTAEDAGLLRRLADTPYPASHDEAAHDVTPTDRPDDPERGLPRRHRQPLPAATVKPAGTSIDGHPQVVAGDAIGRG